MSIQVYNVPRSPLVRPKAIPGPTVSRKHVGRANSTIIGIKHRRFSSHCRGDWLPFVVNEKSGWEIAGVGKRKKLQKSLGRVRGW